MSSKIKAKLAEIIITLTWFASVHNFLQQRDSLTLSDITSTEFRAVATNRNLPYTSFTYVHSLPYNTLFIKQVSLVNKKVNTDHVGSQSDYFKFYTKSYLKITFEPCYIKTRTPPFKFSSAGHSKVPHSIWRCILVVYSVEKALLNDVRINHRTQYYGNLWT